MTDWWSWAVGCEGALTIIDKGKLPWLVGWRLPKRCVDKFSLPWKACSQAAPVYSEKPAEVVWVSVRGLDISSQEVLKEVGFYQSTVPATDFLWDLEGLKNMTNYWVGYWMDVGLIMNLEAMPLQWCIQVLDLILLHLCYSISSLFKMNSPTTCLPHE